MSKFVLFVGVSILVIATVMTLREENRKLRQSIRDATRVSVGEGIAEGTEQAAHAVGEEARRVIDHTADRAERVIDNAAATPAECARQVFDALHGVDELDHQEVVAPLADVHTEDANAESSPDPSDVIRGAMSTGRAAVRTVIDLLP